MAALIFVGGLALGLLALPLWRWILVARAEARRQRSVRLARRATVPAPVRRLPPFPWHLCSLFLALSCLSLLPGALDWAAAPNLPQGPLPVPAVLAPIPHRPFGPVVVLKASWYGPRHEGRPTASGEPFDPAGRTVAHRTLPLLSWVQILTPNGWEDAQVTDRGPWCGRHGVTCRQGCPKPDIDLSERLALDVGLHERGVGMIRIRRAS